MGNADSVLAFDPGLNNPAAALFRRGRLVAASRIRPQAAWRGFDVGERCRLIARAVHDWACEVGLDMNAMVKAYENELEGYRAEAKLLRQESGIVALVIEWPQIYVRGRSKGDPNDLLPLAGVAMCLAGRLDVEVVTYKPAQWIGQCPKSETGNALESPRGRLVWRNLDPGERETVIVSHDAIDAVGIGLAFLGRLSMRIYPSV